MSKRLLAIACVVGFWAVGVGAQVEERTVIDSERYIRTLHVKPWMMDYDGIGMRFSRPMAPGDTAYFLLRPDAIKGPHLVHFQHFTIEGQNTSHAPTEELLAFERDEVRQGREPFFITATYEGRKRPVLCKWGLPGGLCEETNSCGTHIQAINIGDDRFVKFWVKNYARRRLSPYSLQNWCIQIDNSMYMQQKFYRVLDDDGNPQKAPWDEPFPQNDDEFADAAAFAFRRIKELAPDLMLILNQVPRPLSDESRYGEVFGPIDGESFDSILDYPFQSSSNPDGFWNWIQRILPPDGAFAYKLQALHYRGSSTINEVQQKFLLYIIICGPNAFFPTNGSNQIELDPQWYSSLKNALGAPVEPLQSELEPGGGPGYRLYWRRCQGGIAYFNMSGVAKTIYLPEDGVYYDAQGNPTTVLALGHQEAGYVTFEPGERVAKPRIDPRRPGLVTGPLTITMETEPFSSGTTIVYTLDGSEPDEGSTVYTGPFEINASAVVKAKAFDARRARELRLPSFTNFATYRLTDQEPTVEFHHAYDNGSEFLEHDYPVVSLSHVSAHPVTIRYSPLEDTARPWEDYELEPGTLTIRPGEQHRYFYVHIVNDAVAEPDETLMISISDPVNATLGENTIYTYTIEDNDRDPPVPPSPVPPVPPITPIIVKEDFETGDFSIFDWTFSGHASWAVTSEEKNSGTYSAQAGSIKENESSTLRVELDCISGDIIFYCKVSSERDCDFLKFYIDGVEQDNWSGRKDWIQVSFPVTSGVRTFKWVYSKDSSISGGSDTAWIDDIVFPILIEEWIPPPPPPPPVTDTLSEALDTALSFTTGGSADWFRQTTTSRYDGDAAQSGDISHSQDSWMQTNVSGTGTVKFYWKVSSEEDFDFLEFYIDGSLQEKISGSLNWQQKWYTISTSGSHTLEWRYMKDGSGDSGSDCGWVDKVEWVVN